MEGKIVVEGKEVASLSHSKDGFTVKINEEGKTMCKEHGCCK